MLFKLLTAFDEFANNIAAQLLAQTRLKDLYAAITYTWYEATQTIKGDLSGTVSIFADKLAADREQGKAELAAFVTNLTYGKMGDVSGFLDEKQRRAA